MKRVEPRYANGIYIADAKHLKRSINRYIGYDSVIKIYLVYSSKYNRYQLFLNSYQKPEHEKEEEENYGILIYDRFTAIENRTSTTKILEVIDSTDIFELQQDSVLDKVKKIVLSYGKDNTDLNKMFDIEPNVIIDKFKSILPFKKAVYTQFPSFKQVDISNMLAKRLYYTILNKLNLDMLKFNQVVNQEWRSEADSMQRLEYELQSLAEKKYNHRQIDFYETPLAYEDIIPAIELYGSTHYDIDAIAPMYTLEMLLHEKIMHDENDESYRLEHNREVELKTLYYDEVRNHFRDYIKIETDIERRSKNFTKNAITRYINNFSKRIKSYERLSGSKRKESCIALEKDFGEGFREFDKKLRNFSDSERKDFINKIFLLKKYSHILNNFSKDELDKIFNNQPLGLEKKEFVEPYYTVEELKRFDGCNTITNDYYDCLSQIHNLEEKYYDGEDENDLLEEIHHLKEKASELDSLITELYDKYDKRSYHASTIQFMNRGNDEDESMYQQDLLKQFLFYVQQGEPLEAFQIDPYRYFLEYDSISINDVVKIYDYNVPDSISLNGTFNDYEEFQEWKNKYINGN